MGLTRREFLKHSGLTASMLPLARYANAAQQNDGLAPAGDLLAEDGQRLHSVCGLCKAKCLITGVVQGGRLIRIEGNPESPSTNGKICARGLAATKMLYDSDRLKYPLKRVGARGEGKWARIGWGEAIDTIFLHLEKTLAQKGPDGLALFHNGSSSRYIDELFADLGCRHRNASSQELCHKNQETAYALTGQKIVDGAGAFDGARCIVLLGSHFGENVQVPLLRSFSKAIAQGAKLVVVDPRVSTVASKADYHLLIRPGTDTALLLGWLKYIIEGGLYNRDQVNRRISDLDRFQDQLRDYSLTDIASICDIEVADIKRTAELIASSAPESVIYPGQFSGWYGNDVQRLRAQAILTAMVGSPNEIARTVEPMLRTQIADQQEKLSATIFRKILSEDITFITCWGQNPFQSAVNPYRVQSAFAKAQFIVTCDIYPSETSLYADIILPEATFLERSDGAEIIETADFQIVATKQPLVEPRFAVKDPYWIVKQLSSRLGKGENFHFDSVDERTQFEMAGLGVSLVDIKKNGFARIRPTNGVADESADASPVVPIALFSVELQERGVAPLPLFEPVQLPPPGYSRLVSGRSPVHSNSTTANISWLSEENPEPELWLNDRVAKKLGVHDNQYLFLENQDGIRSLKPVRVKVTPGIRVDTVFLPHGFGCKSPFMTKAFNHGVSDASLVTRSVPDPVSGVRGIRSNFVRFVKNGEPLSIPDLDNPPEILKQYQKWWLDSFGSFEKGDQRKLYV
nr:molybdopterin-dependent oxidoreductase [Desulfobulbaceae bacterium]